MTESGNASQASRRDRLVAAPLALLLVVAIFPDVIFKGASLRLTDQMWGSYKHLDVRAVYPRPADRTWMDGYTDIGGALYQSEPMMEFMRYSLWTLNSPYWNPYSSAGAIGPETLVDQKFSVFTLLYAALKGGSFIYNILTLAFFWFGTFMVVRIVREQLRLHSLAALAAGTFYLLNGYSSANVGSNVAQNYVVVPLCLYCAFSCAERWSAPRFATLTLAFAALLSFTFLPTTIVGLIAIFGCTIGYALSRRGERLVLVLVRQAAAIVLAVAALAVLYLPFVESLPITGTLGTYSARVFYPASWTGLLSLFTSSHFFESYGALEPAAAAVVGNTIFHFGVLGLGLAACAWNRRGGHWRPLVLVSAALAILVLGRVFGAPGVTQAFNLFPVIRSLGCQYWWGAIAIPLVFLVAIGTDNLLRGDAAIAPAIFVMLTGLAAAVTVGVVYGLREPHINEKALSLLYALLLTQIFLFAAWRARNAGSTLRTVLTVSLVALLFGGLMRDAKLVHYHANDIFAHPTSDVAFVQTHIGDQRTMTLGPYATTMENGSAFQIQEVTSLNMGTLPGYRAYFTAMTRDLPPRFRWGDFVSLAYPQDEQRLEFFDWNAVSLLGVKYVVLPLTYRHYLDAFAERGFPLVHTSRLTAVIENPGVFPRAFAVDADGAGQDVRLPDGLDLHALQAVRISRYRNASVELEGSVSGPRLIVLTDNCHPNWHATLDGAPVPIVVVNGTFRGVRVPAGPFRIAMSYRPRTLPYAVAISGVVTLTLVGMACGPAVLRRRRRASLPTS
ncbi:MAG: YfhO family protein [Vicinamibacterales bacterium]